MREEARSEKKEKREETRSEKKREERKSEGREEARSGIKQEEARRSEKVAPIKRLRGGLDSVDPVDGSAWSKIAV